MKSKAGFTLIEITVSIVLVGLIASIAGTSVIMGTRGYLFARENDVITQKAQLALSRLNREIIELSDIQDANSSCIVYESPYGRRAIARVGNSVNLFSPYAPTTCPTSGGDTLVDGVQGLTVYYNPTVNPGPPETATTTWVFNSSTVHDLNSPHHISRLYALRMELTLARQDTGGSVQFVTTASPRNNNNAGGAPSPTSSTPPPQYSGRQCFVTTAAWGDPDHPVVEVLRQFRDQVLIRSTPGEALIRYYYEVGPSLAAAIEDKPSVCLIVRLLVLPVAGFAYLILTCPILIPLILLLSWGMARLILGGIRRRSLRWAPRLQGQRGAMLVTLIATLVVFSALGAIMLGMFGTSALSQASGNNSMRAYYLAESGLRYAASSYIAVNVGDEFANETERNRLLKEDLHNKEFILGSGDGRFKLHIYQYYYPVKSISSTNPQWLDTVVTDSQPSRGFPLSSGNYLNGSWIRIKKQAGDVHEQILGASLLDPNIVQFTRSGPWTGIVEGDEVTPACKAATTTPIVSRVEDGVTKYDLIFQDRTGADIFPEKNGVVMITVQGTTTQRMLAYKKLSLAAYRLQDISDPDGNPLPAVEPGSFIDLTKFIRVESTGTFGSGTSAISRKVTYFVPIGSARSTSIPKTQFNETFRDLSKWYTGYNVSHAGTQSVSSTYGGYAMRVDALAATGPSECLNYKEFEIGLNWTGANIPFTQEWLRAGRYLSYDMQVKMGTDIPASLPQLFGLNFRLDETGNTLGLSFGDLRPGRDTNGCEKDYSPEGMITDGSGYVDSTPVITLWTKQYNKKDSAFVVIPNPGPPGCLAHPPATKGHYTIVPTNLATWETGNRVRLTPVGGGTLPGGIVENGDYFTRKITTSDVDYIYLFDSRSNALAQNAGCWLWDGLQDITNAGSGTLNAVSQDALWTNLAYQTLTSVNGFLGLSTFYDWSTFIVRLIEAPSVSIISGGGATGSEIRSGDTIYTTTDNQNNGTLVTIARVSRSPVYRSANASVRNWSGGSAQAVLILEVLLDSNGNPRPHVFGQGKTLFVGDHPSGLNAGTVNIPAGSTDIAYRTRDNWIAVYVGDTSGRSPADADPYNLYRIASPRFSVNWPTDDVASTAASNDYFTIVRFGSFVNSTLSCKVNDGNGVFDMTGTNCLGSFYSMTNTGSDPDILRFSSPDGILYNSPSNGANFPTSRAEVGLHAYSSPSVYFDDFALQFGPGYEIARRGFLLPLQQ